MRNYFASFDKHLFRQPQCDRFAGFCRFYAFFKIFFDRFNARYFSRRREKYFRSHLDCTGYDASSKQSVAFEAINVLQQHAQRLFGLLDLIQLLDYFNQCSEQRFTHIPIKLGATCGDIFAGKSADWNDLFAINFLLFNNFTGLGANFFENSLAVIDLIDFVRATMTRRMPSMLRIFRCRSVCERTP